MFKEILTFSTLLTVLNALTITSPGAGSNLDPSNPITVTWTHSSSDPATLNLVIDNPQGNPFTFGDAAGNGKQIGTNIKTDAGTYTIPANTITTYGSGFIITAKGATGDNLGATGAFLLSYGSGQVVTGPNSQVSLATSVSSIIFDTSGVTGTMTATYLPSTNITPTVGSATTTTNAPTSRTGSSSSSGASAATSANAQPRLDASREFLSAAGLLAGLVALVA